MQHYLAGAAAQAAEARRGARRRRVRRDRVGRGAGASPRLARPIRADRPEKLAFFTGRDQSQSLTGWWATQFGTPNFAAHGGFCSVNMAAAGLLHHRRLVLGVRRAGLGAHEIPAAVRRRRGPRLEPDQAGLAALKSRGAKVVSVNPVRTGYSAIADEWIGIRPGTDGLFVLALVHELLKRRHVDLDYLVALHQRPLAGRSQAPGAADHGLFARDAAGRRSASTA